MVVPLLPVVWEAGVLGPFTVTVAPERSALVSLRRTVTGGRRWWGEEPHKAH